MKSDGLALATQTFGDWSIEVGPRVWDNVQIWEEIEEETVQANIELAAHLLRFYLEHVAYGLADGLRAKVEFHGGGQYDLGDLLPPVVQRWREKLKAAQRAAESWGQIDKGKELQLLREDFEAALSRTNLEQWTINALVHYNEWQNLQANDLRSVVTAFRELVGLFQCQNCLSFVYALPKKGASETLRCSCGTLSINLKCKGA